MVDAVSPPLSRVTVAARARSVTLTISAPGKVMLCTLTPAQAALLRADLQSALLMLDELDGRGR